MNKIYTLVWLTMLAVGIGACEDDDCGELHIDTGLMGIPTVMKGTFPLGEQMVAIGDSIVFAPELLDTAGVIYSWRVNGDEVSAAPAFTFRVDKPCRAKLVCVLQNARGKTILESGIASVQDLIRGFFVVQNEEIGFYDEATRTFYPGCFQSLNGGVRLSPEGDVFVTQANRRLYTLIKSSTTNQDHLVIAGAGTLSRESSMSVTGNLLYFIPLDERYAIVSGLQDIYRLDLVTMQKTLLTEKATAPILNGIVFNGKLLANTTYQGQKKVVYYDVKALIHAKAGYMPEYTELNIPQDRKTGFVQSGSEVVYTLSSSGNDCRLVKITKDFGLEITALPFSTAKAGWSRLYFCSLMASPTENALFIPAADGAIYKYIPGNAASLATPFVAASADDTELSGTGISVHPLTGELYALYPGKIKVYGTTGEVRQTIDCGDIDPQAVLFQN